MVLASPGSRARSIGFPDGSMINAEAAFTHHLFQIVIRKFVSAIPADAQKDDCRLKVPPLEGRYFGLQDYLKNDDKMVKKTVLLLKGDFRNTARIRALCVCLFR
jgi:hypothetical protein